MNLKVSAIFVLLSLAIANGKIVKNPKTVQQCEENIDASVKSKLCDIRRFKIVQRTDAIEEHIHCVLQAIGFADANGHIKSQKIKSVLVSINKGVRYEAELQSCVPKAFQQAAKAAYKFYTCMLRTSFGQVFKDALHFMELKAAGKLGPMDGFNKMKVAEQMILKEKQICKRKQ